MNAQDLFRFQTLRAEITPSLGLRLSYGVWALAFFALPIALLMTLNHPDTSLAIKLFVLAASWVVASRFLVGLFLSYRFDGGGIACVWLRRRVLWTDGLGGLTDVRDAGGRGPTGVMLIWPDRERRLWLSVHDIDAALSRASSA
jgi:hypothetical protein